MRRGSFRPRPIQNKKALPILQTGVLTFYDETGSHKTTIPQFSHLIDDPNAANIAKSTTLIDIPTPIVHTVQDYKHEVRGGYKPPVYFIRNKPMFYSSHPDLDDIHKMDYSMDSQDMHFLTSHQLYGENGDPRYRVEPSLFEKIIYLLEFECDEQNKVISEKEAEDALVKHLGLVRSTQQCPICRDMYRYWVAKRTRNQKPLLRRFWPITQPADPDPHMVFRPRDEQGMKNRLRRSRKDDKSSYEKLKLLQQDLEQVTRILNSLRKREILKASKVKYEKELFLQSIFDKIHTNGDEKRETTILKERSRLFLESRDSIGIFSRSTSSQSDGQSPPSSLSSRLKDGGSSPRGGSVLTPKLRKLSFSAHKKKKQNPLTSVQMRRVMEAAGTRGGEAIMSVVHASPRQIPSAAVFGIGSVVKAPSPRSTRYPAASSLRRSSLDISSSHIEYSENDKIGLRPEDKKPEDANGNFNDNPPFIPSYMHRQEDLVYNKIYDVAPKTEPSIPTFSNGSGYEEYFSDERDKKKYMYRGRIGRHGRLWIDHIVADDLMEDDNNNYGVHNNNNNNNSNNNEIKQFDVRKMRNFNDILLDLETSVESKNGANDYNNYGGVKRKFLEPNFYAPPHPLASGSKFVDNAKPLNEQLHKVNLEPHLNTPYQIKDNLEKIYEESDGEDDDLAEYGGDGEKPYRSLNFAIHF